MKTTFTKLMAAFALLAFLIPVAGWGQTFTRISAVSELADGDEIIFVNQAETYACGTTQNTNNRTPVAITTSNNSYNYSASDNVQVFVVKINSNGKYGFHTGTGYIYSASSSSNNLKTNTTPATTAPSGTSAWSLSVSNNVFSCTNVTNTSYYLAFNGTSYFSQYKTGQSKPYIYKRVGEPVTYTVTLADDNTTLTQASPGASVTLPTRSAIGSYTFAGWSSTNVPDETTTAPTIIPAGSYTPSSDITLYPVYTRTEEGGTTNQTPSVTISSYATANSWQNSQRYTSITLDENVTVLGKDNGNNSKYYSTSPGTWRHYANDNGEITITVSSGTLTSVTFTYSGNTLKNASNDVSSGTAYAVTGTSAVFAVSGTSGNTQVSAISVSYTITGGTTTYYWSSPVIIPVINASNVEIACDATSGSISYTIDNVPTPAGTLTATIAQGALIENLQVGTITSSAVPFTCAANNTTTSRTATVTLTYTYGDNETVTKNVTITQAADPNALDNISDIAGANELRNVKGTIVAMSSRGFILGDGTGYVYYYGGSDFATTHDIGDVVKLSGTTSSYNHVIQFPTATSITDATNSGYNNTPAVQILDASGIGTYSNDLHLSDYVQIQGTLNKTIVGDNTFYNIAVTGLSNDASISYPTADQIAELEALDDKTVIVKGYFAGVSSGHFNVILESIEELVVPVINASNVTLAYDATTGEIGYEITNPVAGTTLTASITAEWISGITVGAESVTFTTTVNNTTEDRTATVTLTYGSVTKTVTVTQEHFVADYATLPFAFNGGRSDIANTVGLTQENLGSDYAALPYLKFEKGNKNNDGLYSTLVLKINERPGQLSYDIKGYNFSGGTFELQVSADGENYTTFATYTDLTETVQTITINNLAEDVRYIKWVYTQKVDGNVALGNIALEVYQAPAYYTMTIGGHQNSTIIARYGNNQILVNGSASVLSSSVVTLMVSAHEGYVLDLVTVYDQQDHIISLTAVSGQVNTWTFVMPNSNVTISATTAEAHAPFYYDLATTFEPGRRYIIVAERNEGYLAMGPQKNNNRDAKPITVQGATASVTRTDVHEFIIESVEGEEGYYSIYDVNTEAPGYLYAGSSSDNWLLTQTTLDDKGKWEISIDSETGAATIVASKSGFDRNVMRFNLASTLFSCYKEDNNQRDVYLYVKEDTFTLNIAGYANDNVKDGYYLIASPVEVAPADIEGFTTGSKFDLYYYDDSQELEWINYETPNGINEDFGNLIPGKGYLYAKNAQTPGQTFSFTLTGEVYAGNGTITLEAGWNLIGNPYGVATGLDIAEYYVMNEYGSGLIAGEEFCIQPMQGFFVYDEYGGSGVTFSRMATDGKKAGLSLNLSQGASTGSATRGVIDRAIVRFGEGSQLPKFQLNENSTKVYIPQSDKDYAVVRSASEGEMPVNFKAETNGTYTLSMNVEEVSLGYLHLIDNMTGTDVDLLATPSYTFDARTTDYESRFKLVFSSICEDADGDNETFAFFNGSAWTVSNVGEATLQVVDVMGRIVDSQSIQGNATLNLDQTPGIYMLRLVNGDNVKVQKVVVR